MIGEFRLPMGLLQMYFRSTISNPQSQISNHLSRREKL